MSEEKDFITYVQVRYVRTLQGEEDKVNSKIESLQDEGFEFLEGHDTYLIFSREVKE